MLQKILEFMPPESEKLIEAFFARHNRERFIRDSETQIKDISDFVQLEANSILPNIFQRLKAVNAELEKEKLQVNKLRE